MTVQYPIVAAKFGFRAARGPLAQAEPTAYIFDRNYQ
jgi:hypothetical protein